MSEAAALIKASEEDFQKRHPGCHKSRRAGISALAGMMLDVRSANLMELAVGLPCAIAAAENRYQYIERQLKNEAVVPDTVMNPYAIEYFFS